MKTKNKIKTLKKEKVLKHFPEAWKIIQCLF